MASFKQLVEYVVARYQQNGFVEGDFVSLKSNMMRNENIKLRPQSYRDILMSMANQDKPIRITALKPIRGSTGPSATNEWLADIAVQSAPGLSSVVVTVPTEILELSTAHDQWPNVPDSVVHDYNKSNEVPAAPDQTLSSDLNRQLKHTKPQ